MLSFFPWDVLNEIWDLVGSVSEGFPTYSYKIVLFFFSLSSPNLSKRSSSILQNESKSLGLFWMGKNPPYYQRNAVIALLLTSLCSVAQWEP